METINNATKPAALRIAEWETVWTAFATEPTAARWDAMDLWCATNGESNPIPAPAAFVFHAKPAGGGACPVCGCDAKRLRATHRASTSAQRSRGWAAFVKSVKVCFGTDWSIEAVR